MCGIVGYADIHSFENDKGLKILTNMSDEIVHRGPDDTGVYHKGGIGLGMRRLSIIDIAGGHQPMSTPDGRYTLVYNGETYNFKELREDLKCKGYRFKTQCDSEVILNTFADKGVESFEKLNGMFAFAIHDSQENKVHLCRDPIGIKPLYYYYKNGHPLVFASEMKALVKHPAVSRDLNLNAVWDYLTYEYVPGPQTMFKNIYRLQPGNYLTWHNGNITVSSYWDFPMEQDSVISLESSPSVFSELLEDVISSQMVADVPVGIFLSGGLDSSAVAAAAVRTRNSKINTFCIGFEEGTLTDETVQARETATFLGTDHHELITNCDAYLEQIPSYIYAMDEPNADMAAIGKFFASKLASDSVKVVLSGEGGDEMLCGYRMHEAMARFDQLRMLQKMPRSLVCEAPAKLLDMMGKTNYAQRVRRAFLPLHKRNAQALPSMTKRYTEEEKTALFQNPPEGVSESLKILHDLFVKAQPLEPLTQMQYAWSKQWLAEHLLMQADRMSMQVSLELRVPLLDIRLAKFMFSLPDHHKVRKHKGKYLSKYLLREYLSGKVPDSVLNRPKRGFQIPNVRFVRKDLRDDIESVLCSSETYVAQFLNPSEIRNRIRLVDELGDELTCQKLWSLYILEQWCRRWL